LNDFLSLSHLVKGGVGGVLEAFNIQDFCEKAMNYVAK
jgi:hypothetical protein